MSHNQTRNDPPNNPIATRKTASATRPAESSSTANKEQAQAPSQQSEEDLNNMSIHGDHSYTYTETGPWGDGRTSSTGRSAAASSTANKEQAHAKAPSPQDGEEAQPRVQGFLEISSFAKQVDKRMELLRARMLTTAPFNRNSLALDAAWPTIEARLRAEPHILRGSISWLATVFAKIASTRRMNAGISVDPYADDVVFRCEPVLEPALQKLARDRASENLVASAYVHPYFTTQAMEAIVREFERCQFSVHVVRYNDEFACSIRGGVPEIHHVIHSDRPRVTPIDPLSVNPIINAYACVSYEDETRNRQVAIVGQERADAAKKRSQDATSWDGDDSDSMWKKTALRDLISAMPLCPELRSLFALQRGGKNNRMIIETF